MNEKEVEKVAKFCVDYLTKYGRVYQLSTPEFNAVYPHISTDIHLFSRIYCGIQLAPKQVELVNSARDNYHTIAIFSRQTGKSTALAVAAAWFLMFKRNIKIGSYAPKKETSMTIMYRSIVRTIYSQDFIRELIRYKKNIRADGQILLPFWNNELKTFTANETANVRGYDPNIIIIDETQDIIDRMYWEQIIPSGTARKNLLGREDISRIWEAGTPRGRNHFWEMSSQALPDGGWILGNNGQKMTYVIIQPHWESPISDPEKVEWTRENMAPSVFRAEYCCEFMEDLDFVFKMDDIILSTSDMRKRNYKREPAGATYVAGIDLGKSKDHTVISIFRFEANEYWMVYFKQWDLNIEWTVMFNEMADILLEWMPDLTLFDRMNAGDLAGEVFFSRLPCMIRPYDYTGNKQKALLIRHTQKLFEDGKMHLWDEPVIINEFKRFSEERVSSGVVKFSAPRGTHDDIVNSVAMAMMAGKHLDLGGIRTREFKNLPKSESEVATLFQKMEKEQEGFASSPATGSIFDESFWHY